jgi:hypothetical protein
MARRPSDLRFSSPTYIRRPNLAVHQNIAVLSLEIDRLKRTAVCGFTVAPYVLVVAWFSDLHGFNAASIIVFVFVTFAAGNLSGLSV